MAKLEVPQRQECYRLHSEGQTYDQIAQHLRVSKECVRYWCRCQRDGHDIQTHYRHPHPGVLGSFDAQVCDTLYALRVAHLGWGPHRLLYNLRQCPSLRGLALPSPASIGRYVRQWPSLRRPRAKPTARHKERPDAPTRVHQCWQYDFQTGITLQDGTLVNLHTIRDPVGEVCIEAKVFPSGHVGRLPTRATFEEIRATLRSAFARWHTLPEAVQTDNEAVWTGRRGQEEFPSLCTLYLQGLQIQHWVTRPGHPTDNAAVERCHRTLDDYVVVGNEGSSPSQLQAILDQAVHEMAFELPSRAEGCGGLAPVQAHPQLLAPPRPFELAQEEALFDLQRVDAHLATFTWTRKVGQYGQITLGGRDRRYHVGRAYARQKVLVRFDPADRHFVCFVGQPEQEIARCPVCGLELIDITGIITLSSAHRLKQLPLPFLFPQG